MISSTEIMYFFLLLTLQAGRYFATSEVCSLKHGGYYNQNNIGKPIQDTKSYKECAERCLKDPRCKFWAFGKYTGVKNNYCYIKTKADPKNWIADKNWLSGQEACGDDNSKQCTKTLVEVTNSCKNMDKPPAGVRLNPSGAVQSSVHEASKKGKFAKYGKLDAQYCIDGDLASICHTGGENFPWLAIKFNSDTLVQKVSIINRKVDSITTKAWEKTKNLEVRVAYNLPKSGKERFTEGELLGSLAGPAGPGDTINIYGSHDVYGTVVVIQVSDGNKPTIINFREVYVYGMSFGYRK